jgi:hypothetical protein
MIIVVNIKKNTQSSDSKLVVYVARAWYKQLYKETGHAAILKQIKHSYA